MLVTDLCLWLHTHHHAAGSLRRLVISSSLVPLRRQLASQSSSGLLSRSVSDDQSRASAPYKLPTCRAEPPCRAGPCRAVPCSSLQPALPDPRGLPQPPPIRRFGVQPVWCRRSGPVTAIDQRRGAGIPTNDCVMGLYCQHGLYRLTMSTRHGAGICGWFGVVPASSEKSVLRGKVACFGVGDQPLDRNF